MTKTTSLTLTGDKEGEIELPLVFSTPFRRELIHKAWTNLNSHKFQRQGRHPTAGMDVVADTNNPPTGQGISRIARMRGGGGGRQGQAGEVASIRGGRQAHPPNVNKVIYKKLNKKENKLALCSAISSIAPLEYTVNLIGSEPGDRSKTLKSLIDLASTPGIEPHALLILVASFVTNKTLFPTFLLLPLRED